MVLSPGITIALALFMVFMIAAPVLTRISERHGVELLARILAYVGFTWMSLIFLFVSCAFVLDVYGLLLHAGSRVFHADLSGMALLPKQAFIISFMVAVISTGYGAFAAVRIGTEHVVVETRKLPETVARLRIAQISDVHLGIMVREKRLQRILDQVKQANPDVLVSTGDLVDGQTDNLSKLEEMFREIHTKHGKFAVTGNHEFYAGLPRALAFLKNSGFIVLRGEGVTVSGMLNIAGVDDPAANRYGVMAGVSEKALLDKLPQDKFTLLLKHRPVIDDQASGLFDLQLSGHTHKGQIFPFNFLTMLFYSIGSGLHELDKNGWIYVSRGTGTWGPPVRFLSPPEVTVIDLVHKKAKAQGI
ncbi:MAG: metallophosphoesterase [Deltaproteobacteria bacterium]|nr:metallophosphoesterase [Deltaproteobacteria bacterium]